MHDDGIDRKLKKGQLAENIQASKPPGSRSRPLSLRDLDTAGSEIHPASALSLTNHQKHGGALLLPRSNGKVLAPIQPYRHPIYCVANAKGRWHGMA
jgi:hypothetical protein